MSKPHSAARVLLLQSRYPEDTMILHERHCINEHLGAEIHLHAHNAITTPFPIEGLSEFDGLVFGGSGDCSVIDPQNQAWVTPLLRIVEQTLQTSLPAFGLCFGHQLLAKTLGAPVETRPDQAESGTISINLTKAGREDPLFGPLSSPFRAHTGHSDSVMEVPTGVTLLASGEHHKAQAFRVEGRPFFSTQFHPDLTGAQAQERYRAYQAQLPSPNLNPNEEHFTQGADEATGLLYRFGRHLLEQPKRRSPPVA